MGVYLNDKELDYIRRSGLSYTEFMHLVCDGCKFPCYIGEERCDRLDKMRKKFGF